MDFKNSRIGILGFAADSAFFFFGFYYYFPATAASPLTLEEKPCEDLN